MTGETRCERFPARLEPRLARHDWLLGDSPGVADIAIFPCERQFAQVGSDGFMRSRCFREAASLWPMRKAALQDSRVRELSRRSKVFCRRASHAR